MSMAVSIIKLSMNYTDHTTPGHRLGLHFQPCHLPRPSVDSAYDHRQQHSTDAYLQHVQNSAISSLPYTSFYNHAVCLGWNESETTDIVKYITENHTRNTGKI